MSNCTAIFWCDGRPDNMGGSKHFTKCNGTAGHETQHTGECPEFGWVRDWYDHSENGDKAPPGQFAVYGYHDKKWELFGPYDTSEEAYTVCEALETGVVYQLKMARIVTKETVTVETAVEIS